MEKVCSYSYVLKYIVVLLVLFLSFVIFSNYINLGLYEMSFALYPWYKRIDPHNVYMFLYIHHFGQAFLFLIIIYIFAKIFRLGKDDFGLNLYNWKFSLLFSFTVGILWFIIQFSIGWFLIKTDTMAVELPFLFTKNNIVGYIIFQILVSGTSEEIIFRGFVIAYFMVVIKRLIKKEKHQKRIVILLSTLIFMIAHINFQLFPFKITYINPLQQVTCFIASLLYVWVYFRTNSIMGSMLTHNFINGAITISSFLLINAQK